MLYGGDVTTSCAEASGMARSRSSVSPRWTATSASAPHPADTRICLRRLPHRDGGVTGPDDRSVGVRDLASEGYMAIQGRYGHTSRQGHVRARCRHRSHAGADRASLEGDEVRGAAACHPRRCHDGAGGRRGRTGRAGGAPAGRRPHAAEGPRLGRDGSSRATCRIGPPRTAATMIHLDTSFLIHSLVAGSREDRLLRAWLRDAQPIGMSVVGWAEFLCGPVETTVIELAAHLVGEPEGFTAADCSVTARLFNLSGRRRGSFTDCMIAAVAIRAGAALATSNRDDFARFAAAGLRLADH